MKIAVIGTGYVGLVTGSCFAETGNEVTCVDNDPSKIEKLKRGEIPFYEPGIEEIVSRNLNEGRLLFSTDTVSAVKSARACFICVGTPSKSDGSADLKYVFEVAEAVADVVDGIVLTIKSTVPIGTNDEVQARMEARGKQGIRLVSNPEFLREGSAVMDCLQPDRVVVGTDRSEIADLFRELYAPYVRTGKPIFIMDIRSAEMTKYAANALLAQRISFMNEISMLCDAVGADISLVRKGIGADHRIGEQYLFPSVGFGGSCFPKDVRALVHLSEEKGVEPRLLRASLDVNEAQKKRFVERVIGHFGGAGKLKGSRMAIWGLAFKAKTDDIRESPALTVIDGLLEAGVSVAVFDPVANGPTKAMYGDRLTYVTNAYAALEGARALCVLTEWNQFRTPDFGKVKKLLKEPVIFDGRNLYEPEQMKKLGFTYYSIGRPSTAKSPPTR